MIGDRRLCQDLPLSPREYEPHCSSLEGANREGTGDCGVGSTILFCCHPTPPVRSTYCGGRCASPPAPSAGIQRVGVVHLEVLVAGPNLPLLSEIWDKRVITLFHSSRLTIFVHMYRLEAWTFNDTETERNTVDVGLDQGRGTHPTLRPRKNQQRADEVGTWNPPGKASRGPVCKAP
jgi:hypothetical protein